MDTVDFKISTSTPFWFADGKCGEKLQNFRLNTKIEYDVHAGDEVDDNTDNRAGGELQ